MNLIDLQYDIETKVLHTVFIPIMAVWDESKLLRSFLILRSHNTRHKSLKQTPFLSNFLEKSLGLLVTQVFSLKCPFSLPNVEPRVF